MFIIIIMFLLTFYIFQSYQLLFYNTLKWVILTSLNAVACMYTVILLIRGLSLVLLHAFEPFLSSYDGFLCTVYSRQN